MAVEASFLRANIGRLVQVKFKPNWPVPLGNYTLDGFEGDATGGVGGIWVTHEDGHQRYILAYDIEEVKLRDEVDEAS